MISNFKEKQKKKKKKNIQIRLIMYKEAEGNCYDYDDIAVCD